MNISKKTKPVATEKDKKSKLVRDSFTIPKQEYAAIDGLKARALAQGVAIKKSELLRAGLMALNAMSDAKLKAALAQVPTLKTGRPSAQDNATIDPLPALEAAPAATPASEAASPAAARKTRQARQPRSKPIAEAGADAAT